MEPSSIGSVCGVPLFPNGMQELTNPDGLLDDSIIESYMRLCSRDSNTGARKIQVLGTHHVSSLFQDDDSHLLFASVLNRAEVPDMYIGARHHAPQTRMEVGHWSLLYVFRGTAYYLDPISNRCETERLRAQIRRAARLLMKVDDDEIPIRFPKHQTQPDCRSCGIVCLMFAEHVIRAFDDPDDDERAGLTNFDSLEVTVATVLAARQRVSRRLSAEAGSPTSTGTSQTSPKSTGTRPTSPITSTGTSQTSPTSTGTSQTSPKSTGTSQTSPKSTGTSQTSPTSTDTSSTSDWSAIFNMKGKSDGRTTRKRKTTSTAAHITPTPSKTARPTSAKENPPDPEKAGQTGPPTTTTETDPETKARKSEASTPPDKKGDRTWYQQTFKTAWLKDFAWLSQDAQSGNARCQKCNFVFTAGSNKSDLSRHERTAKHTNAVQAAASAVRMDSFMKPATSKKLVSEIAEAEVKIAGHMAEHNVPFRHADHLTAMMSKIFPDSKIAKGMKMKRTKASYVTQYGIAHKEKNEIRDILRTEKFSVLIDESTDRSVRQILAIVVRYFDHKREEVVDALYRAVEVEDATAKGLYDVLRSCFREDEIPLENVIGFGADNCSTMMGQTSGFHALIKAAQPSIFVLGCICHSFHLCASAACKKLPDWLETFLRYVSAHFARSSKRSTEFRLIQKAVSAEEHKMLKLSSTRWLSRAAVIARVLEQWEALKIYFGSKESNPENDDDDEDQERKEGKIGIINRTMNLPGALQMLLFLNFVIPKVDRLNQEFQSQKSKIHQVYSSIKDGYRSLLGLYVADQYAICENLPHPRDESKFKPINEIVVGSKCAEQLWKLRDKEAAFRTDCRKFLIELCDQMRIRFDFSPNSTLAQLGFLSPTVALDAKKRPGLVSPLARKFPNLIPPDELDSLDEEWRSLLYCRSQLSSDLLDRSTPPERFWAGLHAIQDMNESAKFPLLTKLVFGLMALPHSTAAVERIFSKVNQVKHARTNRLLCSTVQNIILAKQHLSRHHEDCITWTPDPVIVKDVSSGRCRQRYQESMKGEKVTFYDIDGFECSDEDSR